MENLNRIIEFRAWHKGKKQMWYKNGSDWLANFWQMIEEDPDAFELQQFTGLHDKNGKEMYEGDIVNIKWRCEYKICGEIVFNNLTYKLKIIPQPEHAIKGGYIAYHKYWDDGEHDWETLEHIASCDCEVIGNKYENPNLLAD